MLVTPSYELTNVFAYARKFSLERNLYYIDSQIILLGILDSFANDIAIDMADREKLIYWLNALNWEKGQRKHKGNTIPLTTEAERMLENAAFYQKKLGDKHLSPQHIILSLLTSSNRWVLCLKPTWNSYRPQKVFSWTFPCTAPV
jgi:ATP-dependent Clp protease ATP-binding subunit ClpA